MDTKTEQIRLRAWEIWKEEGEPEGAEERCWHQAEQELNSEEPSPVPHEGGNDGPATNGTESIGTGGGSMEGEATGSDRPDNKSRSPIP